MRSIAARECSRLDGISARDYPLGMSDHTRRVLGQALRLPRRDRAALVAELLRTLDGKEEKELSRQEWENAWVEEVQRRAREVRVGTAELIDGDEALKRVRAGLKRRRK